MRGSVLERLRQAARKWFREPDLSAADRCATLLTGLRWEGGRLNKAYAYSTFGAAEIAAGVTSGLVAQGRSHFTLTPAGRFVIRQWDQNALGRSL